MMNGTYYHSAGCTGCVVLRTSKVDEIWPTPTKTPERVGVTQGRWTLQDCLLWAGTAESSPDYWPSFMPCVYLGGPVEMHIT